MLKPKTLSIFLLLALGLSKIASAQLLEEKTANGEIEIPESRGSFSAIPEKQTIRIGSIVMMKIMFHHEIYKEKRIIDGLVNMKNSSPHEVLAKCMIEFYDSNDQLILSKSVEKEIRSDGNWNMAMGLEFLELDQIQSIKSYMAKTEIIKK